MFEKEAEEYLKKDGTKAEQILNMLNEISPLKMTLKQLPFMLAMIQQIFKDGAEFGYNKANEWHFVKDGDLPKVSDRYWVYTGGEPFTLDFDTVVNAFVYWCLDVVENLGVRDSIFETVAERDEDEVIAWKEIVLPKEIAE